ncbi:MAG: hypothetical protein ACREES_08505, partial [Stellaceae bacterium]
GRNRSRNDESGTQRESRPSRRLEPTPPTARRRIQVISLFLWLIRIPVPVLILLYLFKVI